MCDYTHTSNNQIARYFNEDTLIIEPTFKDTEIIDTLKGNYVLMELFAKNYIQYMKQSNLLDSQINL